MDVDNVSYLNFFDCPPESFPWTEQRVEEIQHRRAAMSDSLLFDILLSLGGIPEPDTLFPPIDADSLRRLLQAIGNSRYDELKKECLVYMLLKAYPDGRAEVFREKRSVLPQFCSLAEAYWLLDSGLNIPVSFYWVVSSVTRLMSHRGQFPCCRIHASTATTPPKFFRP